jgi:hypothetical protein
MCSLKLYLLDEMCLICFSPIDLFINIKYDV